MNGAISNDLPRRAVLVVSAGFCAAVAAIFTAILVPESPWFLWCTCLGLGALGAAVYSPARYALFPAAAQDAEIAAVTLDPPPVESGLYTGSIVAVGADGVMIDIHPHPEAALCDGPQALTTDELPPLVAEMGRVAKAVGRPLARSGRGLSAVGE